MPTYQIFHGPMTTSEYPDPSAHARYIRGDDGFRDYVLLEDAIWNALCVISRVQSRTVDELCCDINESGSGQDFATAARIYVLSYVAQQLSANAELSAELRAFGKPGGRRSAA